MTRCFISINLPEEIRKEIKKIQEQLPEFKGKKTELENLHLTLKFLGEIDEVKIEEIKEKLKEIKIEKFETEIDEAGIFSERLNNSLHIRGRVSWSNQSSFLPAKKHEILFLPISWKFCVLRESSLMR